MRFVIDDAPARGAHRPDVRAGVRRVHNGYEVPGRAVVAAWPHRPLAHARQIARRLTRDTWRDYAAVIRQCDVAGVTFPTGLTTAADAA
jgi:hypothetical protein